MLTSVTMLTSHRLSHTFIIAFQESDSQNVEQQISRMSLDPGAPPEDPPAEAAQVKEETTSDLVECVATAKRRREDQIDELRVRWGGLHFAVIDTDSSSQEEYERAKDMLENAVCTVPPLFCLCLSSGSETATCCREAYSRSSRTARIC
jgi:hypothetical protein